MAEDLSINKNKIFTNRYGNTNNDICRLCLKNEAHMEPLFYANLFPNILLTKKIYDCTSIQIMYERNLPMFVCKLCANKLDEYVRFRERCIANDDFLRSALAAFDMAAGSCNGGSVLAGGGMIKREPEDTVPSPLVGGAAAPPPPPVAPSQPPQPQPQAQQQQRGRLGVIPIAELNCALAAAAAAAAAAATRTSQPLGKQEPPDDEKPSSGQPFGCGMAEDYRTTVNGGVGHKAPPFKGDGTDGDGEEGDEDCEEDDEEEEEEDDEDDGGRYVCEMCPKSFKLHHHLLAHLDNQHSRGTGDALDRNALGPAVSVVAGGGVGGKPAYSCPKCAKVFVNRGNLLNHLDTHTNEKSYSCDICSKSFKYNVQLRLHMRIHTGERPHKCEICNRGFSQLSNLRSHRKTHSKVKPYKCHLCLKSFTVLDNLTAHSAKCLKDKFRCTLCSKSFAKEGNLLAHLQSHSEGIMEKMFKCEMCPKSFKNKEDWKRHVRVHTGEKPYTCDICSKGFAQKANLLSHRKTHLKPTVIYKCDRCDRTFRTQKVLDLHHPKCTGEPSLHTEPPRFTTPGGGSVSPVLAVTPPATALAVTPTLSEALSDLLRYEIALRAPLELQQMLLGAVGSDQPSDTAGAGGEGVGGRAVGGGRASGRRYRCDVCFKGYSQYPSLIKHRKLHFKVPPLVKTLGGDKEKPEQSECELRDEVATSDGRDTEPPEPPAVQTGPVSAAAPAAAAAAPAFIKNLPPEPGQTAERPYGCDICGGRFEAPSAHPPDRCREDLQLRVLLEQVPLERGPEAPPAVAHRRTAVPVPALPEGLYPAVEPAGPHEDPRSQLAAVGQRQHHHHHQHVPRGLGPAALATASPAALQPSPSPHQQQQQPVAPGTASGGGGVVGQQCAT